MSDELAPYGAGTAQAKADMNINKAGMHGGSGKRAVSILTDLDRLIQAHIVLNDQLANIAGGGLQPPVPGIARDEVPTPSDWLAAVSSRIDTLLELTGCATIMIEKEF